MTEQRVREIVQEELVKMKEELAARLNAAADVSQIADCLIKRLEKTNFC